MKQEIKAAMMLKGLLEMGVTPEMARRMVFSGNSISQIAQRIAVAMVDAADRDLVTDAYRDWCDRAEMRRAEMLRARVIGDTYGEDTTNRSPTLQLLPEEDRAIRETYYDHDHSKVWAIKKCRELTSWDLPTAKDYVESLV